MLAVPLLFLFLSPQLKSQEPDLPVEALAATDHRQVGVYTGVRHTLPVFDLLYDDAGQLPGFARRLCMSVYDARHRPEAMLYHAFRAMGAPAGGFGPPLAGTGQSPVYSIEELKGHIGLEFPGDGSRHWERLPAGLQSCILRTIGAWMEADRVLEQFLLPLAADPAYSRATGGDSLYTLLMQPWQYRQLSEFGSFGFLEDADLRKLSYASRLLAAALTGFMDIVPVNVPEGFGSCVMESHLGRIGIFGPGKDSIPGGYSLVVDLGGGDTYHGDAASSRGRERPVSMVVDLAGDDSYRPQEGRLGSAVAGVGILLDLAGNDHYETDMPGLASACYGTALLYDLKGDDTYVSGSRFSQGASHTGCALLADLEGDDRYISGDHSQGYGGTLGVGILLDVHGNDHYNDSPQAPSFVQGAARGRWAEATDGHSLGGGLGIFIDGGGDDHYRAQSFSQGASYFTGTGLFFDLKGEDHYDALSHSQGYSAHYSLAGFFESAGNDRYNENSDFSRITQVTGGGRDLSLGWFMDSGGDDIYHIGNRSGGIGDLDGTGIFHDTGGLDSLFWHRNGVNAASPSLGKTIGAAGGMGIGVRLFDVPHGDQTGVFRKEGPAMYILEIGER